MTRFVNLMFKSVYDITVSDLPPIVAFSCPCEGKKFVDYAQFAKDFSANAHS